MHELFVTRVYQGSVKFNLNDLKKEIYQIQKADVEGQNWSAKNYQNGYTSYGSWDQLHRLSSSFESLQKQIDKHVVKFVKSLDYEIPKKALILDTIWVNIMPAGSLHTAHIHPQSVISGSFYVEVPKGASAIKFEDPRLGLFMNSPLLSANAKKSNSRFFSLQPKAGDLVLFESWLKHEVPLNTSQKPRISVSFNYGWA